ncbi:MULTISPECIES: recombinase family protein [unclassified Minwuia]|uniref:recombinase family protein n=1 Tax=unclassified Minwuia TaxID=2618799 RepID=UPI00247930F1|nr:MULTISPECIES: recombinase family protein [unclassified Minwuia]
MMTERGRRGGNGSINHRSATGGLSHGVGRRRSVRCAIYTRKSTEEGLEQAFNSLDAQREACAAYIRSQQHEGWTELPTRYDDGGFSGGSMDRPALASLLDDLRAGRIDTVVVYKVDRLTRSLADFAKIVELFEEQGVSFVSVTQQFNTTTSMGRLTLNVLLSFAQFEREVTAERIRDKIAASKKKGMWMGGAVPIGYRVEDRRLVIDPDAAATVRRIFGLYLNLGSVRDVKDACDRQGIVTATRTSRTGRTTGGTSFSRGHLYWLLRNPIYIGRMKHHGQTFDGQHEPIIDDAIWGAVQEMLDGRSNHRQVPVNVPSSSHLLKGRLFDDAGEPLYATQASKQGQRYFYYTSKHLVVRKADSSRGWRLPAPELDQLIIGQLVVMLRDPLRVMDLQAHCQDDSNAVTRTIDAASRAADILASADGIERRCMLDALLERVELRESGISLGLRPSAINGGSDPGGPGTGLSGDGDWTETVVVELSVQLSRRANGSRIVLGGGDQATNGPDPKLVQLVADAHRWNRMLAEGTVASLRELSDREQLDRSDIGRILNLAYLAPDIVEAILDGRQPVGLTVRKLRRMSELPLDWEAQRRMLGFEA